MASLVGQVRLTHPVCRDARSLYEARWCLPDWYQNGDGRKEQRDKEGQRDREAAKREGRNASRSTLEFGNTLTKSVGILDSACCPCLFLPVHVIDFSSLFNITSSSVGVPFTPHTKAPQSTSRA